MKTISIRQLHAKTGEWVRRSKSLGSITVTDRGRAVAQIVPVQPASAVNPFAVRQLRADYARLLGKLNRRGTDSTHAVAEDRERR